MAGDDAGRWPSEELPAAWRWVDFTTFFSDFTDSHRKVPQKQYKRDGALAVVDQGATRIGGYTDDLSMQSSAPLPAIVFGDHTRAVKYIDIPFAQGADGVRVLAPNDHTEPAFAYQALRCLELPDKGYSRHFKFLKASRFPLPPLSEQRRIVAKIDSLTGKSRRARDHLDHIPRLVEKYKQAVLAAAFRGDLTREWRAHNAPARIDEHDLELKRRDAWTRLSDRGRYKEADEIDWRPAVSLPSSWLWASVDQLSCLIQYGTSAKTTDDDGGIAVLRMGNLQAGEVNVSSLKYLPQDHSEFPDLLLRMGDVLFNRTNSAELVGKTAVYEGEPVAASFASYLIRVTTAGILPRLLSAYINSAYGREWVASVVNQQVGQANVNGTKLRQLGVPVMPASEQEQVAQRIDMAFSWIDRLAFEATSARRLIDRLDQAVLAKAFGGELVPQDPEDEPASVLLDRIRAERGAAPKARRGRKVKTEA